MDNKATLQITRSPEHHERSKHIDVKHHFIRERVQNRELTTFRVKGRHNNAYTLTNALSRVKFESGLEKLTTQ
jgi:hypothetical protein